MRARHELTEQRIVEAAEVGGDVDQATRVRGIHRTMRERTMLYAEQMRLLTEFFTRDPEVEGCLDVADVSAMKVAVGLRSSTHRAEALIRDAHRSVELMPRTFEALARGDLPENFHQYLLRRVRRLEDDQVRDVDAHVAVWELASISRSQFERHVRLIVALVSAGTITSPREPERDVRLEHADPASGTPSRAAKRGRCPSTSTRTSVSGAARSRWPPCAMRSSRGRCSTSTPCRRRPPCTRSW
ncbi:hypothetical protein ACTXM8_06860 [Brachybacterium alimentarium]|uniref:hypothetical protein n=1 Tax=Brachybacterium alimentarium TaxID=47845 RepID=UPI003FD4F5BC